MIYTQAQKEDVSKLVSLENELFSAENYPLSRAMFRYHIAHNRLFIAQEGDAIAGYILLLKRKGWVKIYSLGVLDSKRGLGIASKLLEKMFASLAPDERRVMLEVRSDNLGAIALYEKHGFSKFKEIAHFYKDDCSAFVMQKFL